MLENSTLANNPLASATASTSNKNPYSHINKWHFPDKLFDQFLKTKLLLRDWMMLWEKRQVVGLLCNGGFTSSGPEIIDKPAAFAISFSIPRKIKKWKGKTEYQ